ncbi:MAG: PglZ domain-containing protein, partial [Desulfobacterales bacterium]|nr:PglZ domain-containing protein [Desulfobacterales bacterium]
SIIYIYHDQIDAVGDKAASESRTFEAARKALDELSGLINWIINSLNGTRVVITSDHGFIYHDKAPAPIDKSVVDKSQIEIFKSHKRFILGKKLNKTENTHLGNTKVTANTQTNMEFIMPKGT